MSELQFEGGQALVDLDDGSALSILNEDRREFIENYFRWSLIPFFTTTRSEVFCGPGTCEVSRISPDTGECAGRVPGWEQYEIDREEWIVYAYVPIEVINEFVAETR